MPSMTLGELAQRCGAELLGDASCIVDRIDTLELAGPGAVTFLANSRYARHLRETRASAVVLKPDNANDCPGNALLAANPYLVFARIAAEIYREAGPPAGIHPTASVDPGATIHPSASIGPNCTIEADVDIDRDVIIGPNCVIMAETRIGAGSRLVASVTACKATQIGQRCLIQPGAVLGADGFGFANDSGVWVKVPQVGRVVLGDDVEIGACSTVDRGAIRDTELADGVKIDNQVQIAHNVTLGANTAIAAQVGIAGSTRIGSGCTVAGAAGVAGHLELVDGVHISAMTGIAGSIKEPGVYTSTVPVLKHADWRKNFIRIRHLDEMAKRLKALEKQVEALADATDSKQD